MTSSREPDGDGRGRHREELLPPQACAFRIPRRDSGFQECGERREASGGQPRTGRGVGRLEGVLLELRVEGGEGHAQGARRGSFVPAVRL